VPSGDEGKRNPLARQRAYLLGLTSAPQWQIIDMLVGMADSEDCDGGLFLEEEETPIRTRFHCWRSAN
jgi:hypothetical protein